MAAETVFGVEEEVLDVDRQLRDVQCDRRLIGEDDLATASGEFLNVRCYDLVCNVRDSQFTASFTNLRTACYDFGYRAAAPVVDHNSSTGACLVSNWGGSAQVKCRNPAEHSSTPPSTWPISASTSHNPGSPPGEYFASQNSQSTHRRAQCSVC
jgi:hypothetical protein